MTEHQRYGLSEWLDYFTASLLLSVLCVYISKKHLSTHCKYTWTFISASGVL